MKWLEIELHHYRNMSSFEMHFPQAKFIGFTCGYYGPTYLIERKIWNAYKNGLPKSCTINEVKNAN